MSLNGFPDGSDARLRNPNVRMVRVQYNPANDEEIRQDQNRPRA